MATAKEEGSECRSNGGTWWIVNYYTSASDAWCGQSMAELQLHSHRCGLLSEVHLAGRVQGGAFPSAFLWWLKLLPPRPLQHPNTPTPHTINAHHLRLRPTLTGTLS